jgi:bile acid:Na+ symporter, BASS family
MRQYDGTAEKGELEWPEWKRFNRGRSSFAAMANRDGIHRSEGSVLWLAPLWTLLASCVGTTPLTRHFVASTIGTIRPLQAALAFLMLAMGLTITPGELQAATRQSKLVLLNMLCCFGMMPLLASSLCSLGRVAQPETIGTVLLGCVSGGQASNLFALLAGGDVALSVVCTLSTTLVGVVATPFLIQKFLATTVPVQAMAVLWSVATMVLFPLTTGLILGRLISPERLTPVRRVCPNLGLAATMILVAGGAANASSSLMVAGSSTSAAFLSIVAISFLLPILGGALAYGLARLFLSNNDDAAIRTFVIEVLSKSPTLAHVLALRHFGVAAASIPAVSMVSLAMVGALVAAAWQSLDPR